MAAFEHALQELTRDRTPLDWALTHMSRSVALRILGERENDITWLEAAIKAYLAALQVYTRERMPLDWAKVQGGLCYVDLAFFDLTKNPGHLDRAMANVEAAEAVFTKAGATQYFAQADSQIAGIEARRAGPS